MNVIVITFGLMVFCWGIFALSFRRDRSRYINIIFLFAALLSDIPFLINVSGPFQHVTEMIIAYLFLFGVLLVPYYLLHNGYVMLKKEGRSIPHLLSLLLGIGILLGELAFLGLMIADVVTYGPEAYAALHHSFLYICGALFGVTVLYGSVSIMLFTLYLILLQIVPLKKTYDYVIILGAGLIDGNKVSKLLRDRMDKAIDVYNYCIEPPYLIPSGGKGRDETIAEAEAMRSYLLEKGIPEDHILMEDQSATTMENLINSKAILDSREGRKRVALVSSNFHVYRALRHCRKIGFRCTGIGGHTAFYYWPCAVLREYAAVHTEKKEALFLIAGWAVCMVLTIHVFFPLF